jgi:hypothetical protein
MRFYGLNANDNHKEIFPVYGGKWFSRKGVHNWVEKFSEEALKVADDETEVRKWRISTTGKAMGKVCQCWWRDMPRNKCSCEHGDDY